MNRMLHLEAAALTLDHMNWELSKMWPTWKWSNKRIPWFLTSWIAIVWVACCPHLGIAQNAPPNLVLIMADDLSARELPSYGNTQHVMPTLDRLAQEGVQFNTVFATPICRASRMEIITGQYGFHNRVFNNANRRAGSIDPEAEKITNHLTFAQILQAAGYATAVAGKWQMSGKVPNLVFEAGFDEYMIQATNRMLSNMPSPVTHTGAFEADGDTARYWHPAILKNGAYMPTGPEDYGPDLFADFLIDFAMRHQDRPFFLHYAMDLPHSPFWPTPLSAVTEAQKFVDDRANFSSMVEYIDVLVSRLVQALETMGLRENTVIMFTSDNGNPFNSEPLGIIGGKGDPTELGARVPMIVNAPGIVQPGGLSTALVDFTDILPTLVDFAASALPASTIFDGHSLAPLLRGEPYTPREWIFSYLGDRRILRDQRWLLENNSPHQFGQLYDCGNFMHRPDCTNVSDLTNPEAAATKSRFEALLANLPAPLLPIRINFQPQTSPLPSPDFDDDVDYGEVFTDHSDKVIGNQLRSGVSYGWTSDHTDVASDRNLNADPILDTLLPFRAQSRWEITLANDDYYVMVVLGDPAFASTHTLNVEGVNYWDAVSVGPNEFLRKEMLVSVSDGRLTLDPGHAPDLTTRINYIEITPVSIREAPAGVTQR